VFLPSFPVFGSPTATIEVVGNTGCVSSEKAGVRGSTRPLAPNSRYAGQSFHV
jgi:hypothetical protein